MNTPISSSAPVSSAPASRTWRLALLTAGFFSLNGAIVVAYTNPATHYEPSIYEATGLLFFALFFFALCGSLFVIASNRNASSKGLPVIAAYVLLVLSGSVLLVLPWLRSYFFWGRGDVLTHLGIVQYVTSTGFLPEGDFYPSTHLLVASLSMATGTQAKDVFMSTPPFFQVLFAVFAALSARQVASGWVQRYAFVLGMLPILGSNHVLVTPALVSYVLLLLFLWLFMKRMRTHSFAISAALIVTIVALTMTHPLTAAFLIAFLVIASVVGLFGRTTLARKTGKTPGSLSISLLSILAVTWVAWFAWSALWSMNIRRVVLFLLGDLRSPSALASALNIATTYGKSELDIITLELKIQGVVLLLAGLVWIYAFILRKARPISATVIAPELPRAVWVYGFVLAGILFLNLASFAVTDQFRPATVAGVFALGTIGILGWVANRKRAARAIILVVIVAVAWTPASVFASPYVLAPSEQVNASDLATTAWIADFGNNHQPVMCQLACYRLFEGNGLVGAREYYLFEQQPDHFNLTAMNTGSLMIVLDSDRATYTGVWAFSGKFTIGDFEGLSSRASLQKVYTAGEDVIWLDSGG